MKKTKKKIETKKLETKFDIKPITIAFGIFIILLAIIYFSGIVLGINEFGKGIRGQIMMQNFLFPTILITTISTLLLLYLMTNYVSVYLKTKSEFSIGLLAFSIALLVQALTANPLTQLFFGFRGPMIGILDLIPSLFTLVAVIVLVYLSSK
jgi:hypothetical protein